VNDTVYLVLYGVINALMGGVAPIVKTLAQTVLAISQVGIAYVHKSQSRSYIRFPIDALALVIIKSKLVDSEPPRETDL